MKEESYHIINRWRYKWYTLKLLEYFSLVIPLSLAFGMILFYFDTPEAISYLLITCLCLFLIFWIKPLPVNRKKAIRYLQSNYPWMEYSLHLLWKENLNKLEKLQLERLNRNISNKKLEVSGRWGMILGNSIVAVLLIILLAFDLPTYQYKKQLDSFNEKLSFADSVKKDDIELKVSNYKITIDPPAYTGMEDSSPVEFSFKVPEQSKVTWQMEVGGNPESVNLILDQKRQVALSKNNGKWKTSLVLRKPTIYQLEFLKDDMKITSSFYTINVTEDQDPEVEIVDLPVYLELQEPDTTISFTVNAKDDYKLSKADLIMTVSSGSGEAVKFREKRQNLFNSQQTTWEKKITIDLNNLQIEYGNELYFFVEVMDNKFPKNQSSRSNTYIIHVRDTAEYETMSGGGMAADIMPDYFRSQRQIIIDSEKLLKDKPQIKKSEFNSRSNSLAHDQKALRLRYGQFIGMEDDSGIATGTPEEIEEEGLEAYQHDHDLEEEHAPEPAEEEKDLLEEYMHKHDVEGEGTFLFRSVKSKLKAALAVMWDAELYLRLNEPEKSLPYQYKALKLIKEVQNHARIYVQRIGFEPPPVKETARLSGELKEIENSRVNRIIEDKKSLNNMLIVLDSIIIGYKVTQPEYYIDHTLAYFATQEDPLKYIDVLESLRQLKNDPNKRNAVQARYELLSVSDKKVKLEKSGIPGKAWNQKLIESLQ